MSWQPIETAPKGRDILICGGLCQNICTGNADWIPHKGVNIGVRYRGDDYFTVSDYFYVKPTRWQEVPKPYKGK